MTSLVSIVIVTHGRQKLLLRCVESCLQQDFPALEIVVVLNPADPEAEAAIRQQMPRVRIVRTHRNLGAFPAKNIGIANTDGDFIFMMDDDAYFLSTDVISRLVRETEIEPELGAVTCNLKGPRETTIEGRDRYMHVFKDGFTLFPKKVFTQWVGWYPDLFFRASGETYIATGVWDCGRRVKCLTDVFMFHDLAAEGRSNFAWKFYGIRSQNLCAVLREPWFIVPFSLASKCVKGFFDYTRRGEFLIWLKGWWSTLLHLPESLADRRAVSWKTYKLLRRLQTGVITEPANLN